MDNVPPARRSEVMSRVKSKDSRPEILVRRLIFEMGYRYRLHVRDLPGCPDIVFRPRQKVIFVHGCFWHRHSGCKLARMPKSRLEFWEPKLEANRLRDLSTRRLLVRRGWRVLTVWECQVGRTEKLREKVRRFLDAER